MKKLTLSLLIVAMFALTIGIHVRSVSASNGVVTISGYTSIPLLKPVAQTRVSDNRVDITINTAFAISPNRAWTAVIRQFSITVKPPIASSRYYDLYVNGRYYGVIRRK